MKLVLSNTALEFRKEIQYKDFSDSDNTYANTYWDRVILTNNNNYQFVGHIAIANWVTTTNIASWQLFDGKNQIGVFTGNMTSTGYTGTLETVDKGTFTIEIKGDINGYQRDLIAVAAQSGAFTNNVTDVSDTINYLDDAL